MDSIVCTVCSLSVKSHDGAARIGERLMHGACYVKHRTAEAEAAYAVDVASRPAESTVRKLFGACREAAAAELRNAGRVWRPAYGLVSSTVARVFVMTLLASRVNNS